MASSIPIDIEQDSPSSPKKPRLTTIELLGGIFCNICHQSYKNKRQYDAHYVEHNTGREIDYTCIVCRRVIVGYATLRDHCYKKHALKDKFKCQYCTKTFPRQCELKDHNNAMHVFKCTKQECNEQFATQKELRTHEFIHKTKASGPPYQCQSCQLSVDTLDTCEHHIDRHCTFTYTCPICSEPITKEEATQHLTKHFGETTANDTVKDSEISENCENSSINIVGGIFCCYCEEMFKNRVEFDTHFAESHSDEDIVYTCIICEKQFEKYSRYGSHCYEHLWRNKFSCDHCDRVFPRLALLVLHTEGFHPSGGTGAGSGDGHGHPFKCTECARTFATDRHRRAHMRRQHGIQSVACAHPGCDSTFESPKDLVLHQKLHNQELDNWCRQCGLQFPTLASCEKHLDLHKKKLYSCPVCSRAYSEKYLVMNHVPQHFETVLHMCKICGKIFNAKRRLVEHVKTHSTTKNHECKFCGKAFRKIDHLQQHWNIHTGMRPYKCTNCPKTFAGYSNFYKHMRNMHKVEGKTIKNSAMRNVEAIQPLEKIDASNAIQISEAAALPDYAMSQTEDTAIRSESIIPMEQDDMRIYDDISKISANNNNCEMTMLPNDAAFASVSEAAELVSPVEPDALPVLIPREYGPDFINAGLATGSGDFIDLDDHLLPHIDPLLTINTDPPAGAAITYVNPPEYQFENFDTNFVETIDASKWEQPILTKIYASLYGEIDDMTSRMPVINTDIF